MKRRTSESIAYAKFIGQRIMNIRKVRKMGCLDVCIKLGISRTQYGNYEKGAAELSTYRLSQIAKIFGISNFNYFMSKEPIDHERLVMEIENKNG